MKLLFGICTALLLFLSCGGADSPQLAETKLAEPVADTASTPDTCLVDAKTLAGNRYVDYTTGEQVLLRPTDAADWQLEVYNLFDCGLKAVYQLPENFSPDYPYFLADINYNTSQRMVGIRGYKELYVVDLDRQERSGKITPVYATERLQDVESGAILHLEVWEDYLVGTTQDWGAFVFSLDSNDLKPVLPVADLAMENGGGYHSLFLIENEQGEFQAILPSMNPEDGDFAINPLFSTPVALSSEETVYAAGSPYVRLKKKDGELVGVNLYTGVLLPVIEEVE
ncbi:hypothetical protein CEQ90_18115 [Lewinellaceae bacterium SD302]|nr:hypothetical protein CEQ90_18115 [Lewinellaceae bacterium SD302]